LLKRNYYRNPLSQQSWQTSDAFIVRSNLEQYNQTGKVDAFYVGTLSADAQTEKMELYNKLEGEPKETLRAILQNQKDKLEKNNDHWQSSNVARVRALELLEKLEK
jgi:hypothetical protein